MEDKYINNWHRVWSNRSSLESGSGTVLEKLISADGFDSPLGLMQENDWRNYVNKLANRFELAEGESIFEVGCGAGAFLYPFYEEGRNVGGIDYSKDLIQIAQSAMPLAKDSLEVKEATMFNAYPKADIVIANHVIHYFSSYKYAEDVLELMLKKVKRVISISGIPNAEMKEDSEKMRRGLLTDQEYEAKYKGLEIIYFEKEWFKRIAEKANLSVEFWGHEMPGFAQNKFRFDCILRMK